jgi:hypothetical protein
MRYVANPVVVDAWKITKVIAGSDEQPMVLHLENGRLVSPNAGMLARMAPCVGDYWVIQADGYIYLNPKDVFERKYSPERLFNFTKGEGQIDKDGHYSGDPQGLEILANVPKLRRD